MVLVSFLLIGGALAKKRRHVDDDDDDESEVESVDNGPTVEPCSLKKCDEGHECVSDDKGKAICVCAKKCPVETDIRARVCSTKNVTFDSICEVHRQRCMCKKNSKDCLNKEYKNIKVDYYGPCKMQKECTEEQLAGFPHRMREWLFLIMEELAERSELNDREVKVAKQAKRQKERNKDTYWYKPVFWEFCKLDRSLNGQINFVEMEPIRAPLVPLEQCMEPFLEKCKNGKRNISMEDWAKCIGIKDDVVKDFLADQCKMFISKGRN